MIFSYKKRIAFFFVLAILILFLFPFIIVFEQPGLIVNKAGKLVVPNGIIVEKYSGYQVAYVMILQVLYFVTIAIWFYAKGRIAYFLSIITAFTNIICLLWVHIVLTFNIDLDPPITIHQAGIGFYLLVIVNFILFFFSVAYFINSPKRKVLSTSLIDDIQ
jgi:hypothetical protein